MVKFQQRNQNSHRPALSGIVGWALRRFFCWVRYVCSVRSVSMIANTISYRFGFSVSRFFSITWTITECYPSSTLPSQRVRHMAYERYVMFYTIERKRELSFVVFGVFSTTRSECYKGVRTSASRAKSSFPAEK